MPIERDIWINAIPGEAVAAAREQLPATTDGEISDDELRCAVFEALKAMDGQAILHQRANEDAHAEATKVWEKANRLIIERERQPRPSDYELWFHALAIAAPMVYSLPQNKVLGPIAETLATLFTLAEGIHPSLRNAAGRNEPATDSEEDEERTGPVHFEGGPLNGSVLEIPLLQTYWDAPNGRTTYRYSISVAPDGRRIAR